MTKNYTVEKRTLPPRNEHHSTTSKAVKGTFPLPFVSRIDKHGKLKTYYTKPDGTRRTGTVSGGYVQMKYNC